ncbi:MAG: hypothetical protein U0525_01320 [Patescibacteria group bacterium]
MSTSTPRNKRIAQNIGTQQTWSPRVVVSAILKLGSKKHLTAVVLVHGDDVTVYGDHKNEVMTYLGGSRITRVAGVRVESRRVPVRGGGFLLFFGHVTQLNWRDTPKGVTDFEIQHIRGKRFNSSGVVAVVVVKSSNNIGS